MMKRSTSYPKPESLETTAHSHRLEQYSRYAPTLIAGALVVISALFLPLVLFYLAWQLGPPFDRLIVDV